MKKESSKIKIKFSSYQIFVIVLLALTQFSVVLDFMVMSPLGDMLVKSMDLSQKQFGFVVAGYAVSAGISGLLTAGFADRFDRKKLLLFFYVGFILGTLYCGLAPNYNQLFAARIITGIFGGVIGSISTAIVADLFPFEQRGRVMGFMMMGFGASQVLGIPISLFIANAFGWQSPFFMIAGMAAIILLFIILKLQPITKHLDIKNDRSPFMHLWRTVSNNRYLLGFASTCLLSVGGFMMMPYGTAFSRNNLHVTEQQLPYLFFVAGLSTLAIMPLIGILSDKIDKFKIFAAASLWMMVVVVIYTNLTPVPFGIVMAMNVLLMFGIMSRMSPAMALSASLPEMHDRGAFMSINSSLQQIAGGIGAAVGGMIVVQKTKTSPLEHYNTLGYVTASICFVSIFLVYIVSEMVKKQLRNKKAADGKREELKAEA